MSKTLLALVGAIAWGGAAISSAAPAHAIAVTYQSGDYASCSNNADADFANQDCYYYVEGSSVHYYLETHYIQQIKFVETGCNAGGCNNDNDVVRTDFVYSAGRKTATSRGLDTCSYGSLLELGTCAC